MQSEYSESNIALDFITVRITVFVWSLFSLVSSVRNVSTLRFIL